MNWQADFSSLAALKRDFCLQAKDESRVICDGRLTLITQGNDTNIVGSGNMERTDVYMRVPGTAAPLVDHDIERWWAHSIVFPDAFALPAGPAYMVQDFHNYPDSPGQPNSAVTLVNWNGNRALLGTLQIQRFVGDPLNPTEHSVNLGPVKRNFRYDFLYHVRWSSKADGFFDAWVNGDQVVSYLGPTTYPNSGVYFKLANYHMPLLSTSGPLPSSVIHDRVRMGDTREAVMGLV